MGYTNVFVVCFVCFTNIATAASFDCNKAATEVESMICTDDTLGAYDLLLARQYKKTRASLQAYPRKNLQKLQLAWLNMRDETCTNSDICIVLYEKRMEALKTIYAESGVHLYHSTYPSAYTRLTHIDLGKYVAHMIWVDDVTHHINLIRKKGSRVIQTIDLAGDSDNLEYGYHHSLAGKFLTVRDYDKDGHKDLLLETSSGSGGVSYQIWLYDEESQLFNYYGSEQQGDFYPAPS